MKRYCTPAVFLLLGMLFSHWQSANAQIKVGGTPGAPNSNALLELDASSLPKKGLLLPRVALDSANSAAPLGAFVNGMIVFNTATAGIPPNNVTPGLYYSDGTKWLRSNTSSTGGTGDHPWNKKGTVTQATGNTDSVYVMGNVGVGTITPGQRLEIGGTNSRLFLNSANSNLIDFGTTGVAPPGSGSVGQKIRLFGSGAVAGAQYALGIENGYMWFSNDQVYALSGFKWYNGSGAEVFRINGVGGVKIPLGTLDMNGTNKIINLATPTLNTDATTKGYVDSLIATVTSGSCDAKENFYTQNCWTNSSVYSTALNYSGSGYIKYVQMEQDGGPPNYPVNIRITIDGDVTNRFVLAYSNFLPTAVDGTRNLYTIPLNIRYTTTLLVEMARSNPSFGVNTSILGYTKNN